MALQKLSFVDLHAAVKNRIEDGAGLPALDFVRVNEPMPFTRIDLVGQEERNTKTMFIDRFTVHVHVHSAPNISSVEHYGNIGKVQEALTEYIQLPAGYDLWGQTTSGMLTNFREQETNEHHAVLGFEFSISYGFKIKL